MSSQINGIGGAAAPWLTPTAGAGTTTPGSTGTSFAQVAAATGLPAQGTGSGTTSSTGISATGTTSTGTSSFSATGMVPGASSVATSGAGSTTGGIPLGSSGALPSTGSTGTTSTGTIASLSGTDTFLKLLVAQLKNQDPTAPMDSQAFVSELAQFNTVEQMLNLKQAMDTQTTTQQANEGIGMLGRAVTYVVPGVSGNNPTTSQGTVSGVSLGGGVVTLQIGSRQVPLSEVTAVGGSGAGTSVPSLGG